MIATDSVIQRVAKKRLYKIATQQEGLDLPYNEWLKTLFPKMYSLPFAPHHKEFWQHVEGIGDKSPPAYFLVLGRGEGKDANAQGAIVYLGAKERRKFCLYVCATQDLANKNIQTLAGMIGDSNVEAYYPRLASRQLDKYGNSKGWRVDMLRCANGYNVVALGLDASVRGLRLDEYRPDLMIFSDVDSRKDTPEAIKKKIDTIKRDIVPAGADNVAIIFIQNLIHEGIINQVVTGNADFLFDRIVNGPIPAIEGLDIEKTERNGNDYYRIVGGTPTWAGKSLSKHEALLNQIGPTAFRIECQHEVNLVEGGMYADIEYKRCNPDEVPDLISICVACDPAVTGDGDCQAIQVDGLATSGKVYRLYSWEENSTPFQAVVKAATVAVEYGADIIIFETDQGGDLWEESYNTAWEWLCTMTDIKAWLDTVPDGTDWQDAIDEKYPQGYDLEDVMEYGDIVNWQTIQPDFGSERAGSVGSKTHRGQLQKTQYEKGMFIHVRGTHLILEAALGRFKERKPFDLHDAAFWSQRELLENAPATN